MKGPSSSGDPRGNGARRVIRRTGGNERGGGGALTGDEDIAGRRGGGGGRRGEVAAPPQCGRWLQRASGKPRFAPAARRARPAPPRSAPSRRPPRSLVAPDGAASGRRTRRTRLLRRPCPTMLWCCWRSRPAAVRGARQERLLRGTRPGTHQGRGGAAERSRWPGRPQAAALDLEGGGSGCCLGKEKGKLVRGLGHPSDNLLPFHMRSGGFVIGRFTI